MTDTPAKPTRKLFIAVDFDGTLVEHAFPDIGRPVPMAFEWLRRFREYGVGLILWTMRSNSEREGPVLDEAVAECTRHGIEFDFVNEHPQEWTDSPKAYAHLYIDDAALGCPLTPGVAGNRPMVDWRRAGAMALERLGINSNEPARAPRGACSQAG